MEVFVIITVVASLSTKDSIKHSDTIYEETSDGHMEVFYSQKEFEKTLALRFGTIDVIEAGRASLNYLSYYMNNEEPYANYNVSCMPIEFPK